MSQLVHPTIIGLVGVCLRPKPMLLLEYAELGSLASFHPFSNISVNLKHRITLQVSKNGSDCNVLTCVFYRWPVH